ncbi:hypothetical protein PFISCL1PPCAC_20802, partial [Pristionchus fissidentatus]
PARYNFREDLSGPFIESDNERIVSIMIQCCPNGLYELVILGQNGSLVRSTEYRDGTSDMQSILAADRRQSSIKSYRSLTQICGGNATQPALIVAYAKKGDSMELRLLSSETSEKLMVIQ